MASGEVIVRSRLMTPEVGLLVERGAFREAGLFLDVTAIRGPRAQEEQRKMASTKDDVVSTLNNLASIAKDGVNGMKSAVESAKSPNLKSTLQRLAQEREGVLFDIQNAVRSLGGDPEKSGTTAGAAHRGWMNIKNMVTGSDDKALLDECERGEDVAVKAFREASSQPLPPQQIEIVRRGFEQVRKSHDEIKSMRNTSAT